MSIQKNDKKQQLKDLKTELKNATAYRKKLQKDVTKATRDERKIKKQITKLSSGKK